MQRISVLVAALLALASWGMRPTFGQGTTSRRFDDIYLQEKPDVLVFGNSELTLEFDKASGRWKSLTAKGIPGNLISPTDSPTIGFKIDGREVMEQSQFLGYQSGTDAESGSMSLGLLLGIPTAKAREYSRRGGDFDYEMRCSYTLFAREGRLERRASCKCLYAPSAMEPLRFSGFLFLLPGVAVGASADCVVDAPGPFWPNRYVAPDTPYDTLKNRRVSFHNAPDAGFGLLAITNNRHKRALGSWMDTGGQVNYGTSIAGDGGRLSIRHVDNRFYRLARHVTVESDVHRIELVRGQLSEVLAKYRQMCEQRMPLDTRTPGWVREMVLLEVLPSYFKGGFKELAARLPFYREVGFDTVYLMPHWVGGYSPIDLYEVEPRYGTQEDLKAMVGRAHSLGMRVLFDMVIHGFNEKSNVPKDRPELFVHDEQGRLARHPTWKSITTDWASEAYQEYMIDLVEHDIKTYDIDGYRVDAASYKGPSWDTALPYPAYRSGSAAPELMKRMLDRMRRIKPDSVLLSEVFGPVFYTVCNLVHDNQTEAPQFLLEQMDAGTANAEGYKKHMANVFDALPQGANRVYFARNHDTSWFYHFNGYSNRFMAMDAIHVLCVIPEVFAGDRNHGPNPDDDPATYDYYRKLFALRREYPELARGELLLREVECDNPWVFTALRRLNGQDVVVAVSLSDKEEIAGLKLPSSRKIEVLTLSDPISGEAVMAKKEGQEGDIIRLRLGAFGVLAGRL